MSKLQFRLAYRTDAAGKYNPNAPLEGNEDNMFVDANLSSPEHESPLADNVIELSEKGCIMVVADGMGGMNAGEVASAIAIKTVTEYFDNEHLKDKSFRDSRSRMKYMEDVVVAADAAIKADARVNLDHEGMGSTIIMAWLCDDEICLTWCGDSRAYLFRPGHGFRQMSKDHSYVQGLVDEGKITMDEAFDHPNGNIITRSLGDPEKKAKADSVNFNVYQGDIFMLCSDGLSGVLRDHKTYVDGQRIDTENLEDIIAAHRASMAECRDELFAAAERNDWYDNVTAILCEVVSGNAAPAIAPTAESAQAQPVEQTDYTPAPNPVQPNNMHHSRITIKKKSMPVIIAIAAIMLGVMGFLGWKLTHRESDDYSLEADDAMFNNCKTGNDFRAYMKKYPEKVGVNFELAKNRLDEWVKDSINTAQGLAKAHDEQQIEEEKKQKKEEKKQKKEEKKGQEQTTIASFSEEQSTPPKEDKFNGLGILLKDGKKNDSATNLVHPNPNIMPVEEKTKGNENGLKEVTEGLQVTGNTLEDQLYNELFIKHKKGNLSIEDCKKYLKKWYKTGNGANAEHWQFVIDRFKVLYINQIRNCKTVEEIDDLLSKHDALMKDLHLTNTRDDINLKGQALKRKKELEKI